MTVISARRVRLRPRTVRYCGHCGLRVVGSAIRLYGSAFEGDPKYAMYLHLYCVSPNTVDPKLKPFVSSAPEGASDA